MGAKPRARKPHREVTYLSWATPPYAYACGCVLAYADKRLTIFNTYAHPIDQPIAHLRGQHPMTASEPPAKWGAEHKLAMAMLEENSPIYIYIYIYPYVNTLCLKAILRLMLGA